MSDKGKLRAAPGMVVQISPEWESTFAGCLAFVTKVAPWGVEASVLVPHSSGLRVAPVRVPFTDVAVIGAAFWALEDREEGEPPDDQHD